MRIVIVGGGPAGCAAGIAFLHFMDTHPELQWQVTILEQSDSLLKSQGVGITLPKKLLDEYISLGFFLPNIPYFPLNARSFRRKSQGDTSEEVFWEQEIKLTALNWSDVYHHLYTHVAHVYEFGSKVTKIETTEENAYRLTTSTGKILEADLVIGSDGIGSTLRQSLQPEIQPEFAGYIAWRATVPEDALPFSLPIEEHVPYYFASNVHLLAYRIPAPDYLKTKQTLINWVLYQKLPENISLAEFMIDKDGKHHHHTLHKGTLREEHIGWLHQLAREVLPEEAMQLIIQTPEPFIQAISDIQPKPAPSFENFTGLPVIKLGDAAAVRRPHSASGLGMALEEAKQLSTLLHAGNSSHITPKLQAFIAYQQRRLTLEMQRAQAMGEILVSPRDWSNMDQTSTDELMKGLNLFGSPSTEASSTSVVPVSIFPPEVLEVSGDEDIIASTTTPHPLSSQETN